MLSFYLTSDTATPNVSQSTGNPIPSTLEVDSSDKRTSTYSFILVGQTSKRLVLDPHGTLSIHLQALISLPGVYNLNQLMVYSAALQSSDSKQDFDLSSMTLQKPSPPSYIEIEDSTCLQGLHQTSSMSMDLTNS